jgi:putative Holliday junction resolvase
MSRIMAIDVGSVTLGIAVSDPLGVTAQPITTLRRVGPRKDIDAIVALARRHEVTSFLVGLPLRLTGDEGEAAQSARRFAETLAERSALPVETWDERFTTVQAERSLLEGDLSRRRRREVINQVAAALLLQSYLDRQERGAS